MVSHPLHKFCTQRHTHTCLSPPSPPPFKKTYAHSPIGKAQTHAHIVNCKRNNSTLYLYIISIFILIVAYLLVIGLLCIWKAVPEGKKRIWKKWRRNFQIKINGISSRWKRERERERKKGREKKNNERQRHYSEDATHYTHMKIEWNVSFSLSFFSNKKPVACAHPHTCMCVLSIGLQ